eukprot:m.204167 g.204167  ORF g.204167 m.204167 type:complete len:591 (+) comp15774_c0_seq2:281-2053(+)
MTKTKWHRLSNANQLKIMKLVKKGMPIDAALQKAKELELLEQQGILNGSESPQTPWTNRHYDCDTWLHNSDTDRNKAERLLRGTPKIGCFLIREGQRGSGGFVLSVKIGDDKIEHIRIRKTNAMYEIEGGSRPMSSLEEIIETFQTTPIVPGVNLLFPVPPVAKKPPKPIEILCTVLEVTKLNWEQSRAIAAATRLRASKPKQGKTSDLSMNIYMCQEEAKSLKEAKQEALICESQVRLRSSSADKSRIPMLTETASEMALSTVRSSLQAFTKDTITDEILADARETVAGVLGSTLLSVQLAQLKWQDAFYRDISLLSDNVLQELGERTESLFKKEKIWKEVERIQILQGPPEGLRQDNDGRVPMPPGRPPNSVLIRWLQFFGLAINDIFQKTTSEVIRALPEGELREADIKSGKRMHVKIKTDYKDAKYPQVAMNADIVRNCATFDDPKHLCKAFDELVKKFGEPLSVKNSYLESFNAMEESYGYRCVLAVFRYEPQNVTWGDLFKKMDKGIRRDFETKVEYERMLTQSDSILPFLDSKIVQEKSVSMLVEVQLLLRPYLNLRKRSHTFYKIRRCGSYAALCTEFESGE